MPEQLSNIRMAQAAELLARGMAQKVVAERVGISEGYLSDLLNHNEHFQEVLRRKTGESKPIHTQIDDRIDQLENVVWGAIGDNFSAFNKPSLLLALARTANSAKRRSEGEAKPQEIVNVVNIELPAHVVMNFAAKHNAQNEIIEIAGRSLITAQASDLIAEANARIHKDLITIDSGTKQKVQITVEPEDEISEADWGSIEL